VKWKHFSPEEATWEDKKFMHEAYPNLFERLENNEDGVSLKGEGCNTP